MKKAMILAVLALGFGLGTAQADPIYGTWQTAKDDNGNYGIIDVQDCGGTICGTLTKSFDSNGKLFKSQNTGRKLIWDMKAQGGGHYGGGEGYSPDRDKVYTSKMILSGDSLTVKGCILGICRDGGTWTRVK